MTLVTHEEPLRRLTPGPRGSTAQERAATTFDDEACLMLADDDAFATRLTLLTGKQRQVLAMVACGRLNKQIAFDCGISDATVKSHVSVILRRLAIRSRTEAAVRYALHLERRRKDAP